MRHRQPLVVMALLALAACQSLEPTAVHTDRAAALSLTAPEEEGAFQFAIFGDRTGGPVEGIEVLRQAVVETNLLSPDLVMTVGDLVQGYNKTPQWLDQMREYKSVMSDLAMPWYPVAGNHDVYWGGDGAPPGHHEADYEANFGPLWYWFAHKNATFIVLYSDEGDVETNRKGFEDSDLIRMSDKQMAWLERTLSETSDYDHVFVFLHHPRWISERYHDGNWKRVHELLVAAGNVSAVFAGHIHRQRYDGLRDGIAYFTLATIGGIMPMDVPGSGWLNHSLLVTVRANGFEVATIPVGAVLDPEAMTPERLQDVDEARNTSVERLSQDLLLGSDGEASGELRYRVQNDASRPVEVSVSLGQRGSDWIAKPNRQDLTLAPGQGAEIEFSLQRKADGSTEALSIPIVAVDVHYLGEDRRVSFPKRFAAVPLKPVPEHPPESTATPERALKLDGQGAGYWFAPDLIEIESGSFTLEAYVRIDRTDVTGVVIGDYDKSGYALMLTDGRPQFVLGPQGRHLNLMAPRDRALRSGAWHHVAAVYDGAEARLYLDGQLIASAKAAPEQVLTPNELPLFVGGNAVADGSIEFSLEGAVDELRISTVARYRGESFRPVRRFEPDEETVLLLHLDGIGGPFALDASFHGRHGIGIGENQFVAP